MWRHEDRDRDLRACFAEARQPGPALVARLRLLPGLREPRANHAHALPEPVPRPHEPRRAAKATAHPPTPQPPDVWVLVREEQDLLPVDTPARHEPGREVPSHQ